MALRGEGLPRQRFLGHNIDKENMMKRKRAASYWLMIVGVAIVLAAYGWLLFQTVTTGPVILAIVGLVFGTSGFLLFVSYEREARLTYSLPSPLFEYDDEQ